MKPNPQYNPADEPLWLIVECADQTRCFQFPSSDNKAVLVGSCDAADVRIQNAAPIAFFLEREEQWISLTPAYPEADLRLDAVKVKGKRRIYVEGLVELGSVQLQLKVRDAPPTLRGNGPAMARSETSAPASAVVPTAVDNSATTTTVHRSTVSASIQQYATVSIDSPRPISGTPLSTELLEPDIPNFTEWFERALIGGPGVSDTAATMATAEI